MGATECYGLRRTSAALAGGVSISTGYKSLTSSSIFLDFFTILVKAKYLFDKNKTFFPPTLAVCCTIGVVAVVVF